MNRSTLFSPCRRYRYTLWREWGDSERRLLDMGWKRKGDLIGTLDDYLMVIGLNPSTADETKDDPTIRKCVKFAKSWGFGALCMTNLFAWRDTDPSHMMQVAEPVGPDNDRHLRETASCAGMVLAAWGNHGLHMNRSGHVYGCVIPFRNLIHCLAINKITGQPQHPLYVKDSTMPMRYTLTTDGILR